MWSVSVKLSVGLLFSVQELLCDACLLPQHVPAVTPLDRGHTDAVIHVPSQADGSMGLIPAPRAHGGSSCALVGSPDGRGSDWRQILISVPVVVCVAPRACIGSVLKSETAVQGKVALKASCLPLAGPTVAPCLCGRSRLLPHAPLVVGIPYPTLQALCTANPSTSEFDLQKPEVQHPAPPSLADTCLRLGSSGRPHLLSA